MAFKIEVYILGRIFYTQKLIFVVIACQTAVPTK